MQKSAFFREVKEIKELRGNVQVVRRTIDYTDRPRRNRLCISNGETCQPPTDCGKGPSLNGN